MITPAADAMASPVFRADPAHVDWFTARILHALTATTAPSRILDVGCGDGTLLIELARVMPGASLVGVDLSESNVAIARAAAAAALQGDRITIVHGDYLRIQEGQFDLVTASSSLQGIQTSTDELAAKLAHDIGGTGRLIHVTPYRCVYNTLLNVTRRGLRSARGDATDRLILAAARRLHPEQTEAKLRERVSYMYLVLRHDEDGLRKALRRHGFHLVASEPAPHTSMGQPKHRFAVMAR